MRRFGLLACSAVLLAGVVGAGAPQAAAPDLSPEDRTLFRKILTAMDQAKWKRALDVARKADDPLLLTIAQWRWLSAADGLASWEQSREFHTRHADWPLAERRQKLAERRMPPDLPAPEVRSWFRHFPPTTGPGRVRYAEARVGTDADGDLSSEIRAAWREESFTATEARMFLQRYGGDLHEDDHAARLDRLIWDRQFEAATRQLRLVAPDLRALGTARIRLGKRASGVDAAVARVGAAWISDPGLVFERARWRRRAGLHERALELLLDPPPDFGPRPERWWNEVRLHARRLLNVKRFADAYGLVSAYTQMGGVPGVEANWLSGWIALRFLDNPPMAQRHFTDMHSAVSMPVSIARAAYWNALAVSGEEEIARWLDEAAGYAATFYGQMAGRCRDRPIALFPAPAAGVTGEADWARRPDARAMLLLADEDRHHLARLFARRLAGEAETIEDVVSLYRLLEVSGYTYLGLAVLRKATRAGLYVPGLFFPDDVHADAFDAAGADVERSLLLALTRQESAFQLGARSAANARGLMQVLPSTARFVARREGITYDVGRLSTDAAYNITIGSRYLRDLLADYDQSYPLALAGYNAGPGRVKRWLRRYGDPRKGEVAMLDWLELIPISETRNYVQRVLEALAVYRLKADDGARTGWEMPLSCPG